MHIKACDSVGIAVRILTSTLKVKEGQVQPWVKRQWKKKKALEVSGVLHAHLFCARENNTHYPIAYEAGWTLARIWYRTTIL